MKEASRILIAIPSMDYVAAGFAQSLASLNYPDNSQRAIALICGSLIYDARNKLAAQAVKDEFDYVMWFDSDMIFESDTVIRLFKTMEREKADIVSGLYFRRSTPYSPVAFDSFGYGEDGEALFTDYSGELTGVHEVAAVGFGCVLMKADVIFDVFAKYKDCFSPIGKVGEDMAFCWRARQLGYKILLDTDIKCGHFGHVTVTEQLYKALRGGSQNEA